MKALRKNLLAIAALTALSVPLAVSANPWGAPAAMGESCPMMDGGDFEPMMGGMGARQQRAMMRQYHAERMELLAARLKLKPEQEALWQGFLTAQDTHRQAKFRALREMRRNQDVTAPAYFEGRVKFMEQNLASMKALNKAATDLYAGLDATQKQVMDKFFVDMRPAGRSGERRGQRMMDNNAAPATPNAADNQEPAADEDSEE